MSLPEAAKIEELAGSTEDVSTASIAQEEDTSPVDTLPVDTSEETDFITPTGATVQPEEAQRADSQAEWSATSDVMTSEPSVSPEYAARVSVTALFY